MVKAQNNLVRLCGRIINRYDKNNVSIVTLRITEIVKGEKKVNNPVIYFFHSDETGVENFFLHDDVVITAHVATPRKYRNNGEEYISQALVGDTIAPRKRMYEILNIDGMGKGPLEPLMNEITFSGTLTAIRKIGDKSAQIVVDTVNNGHRNVITANVASADTFKMQIGDSVTVSGKIITGYYEQDEKGHIHRPKPNSNEKPTETQENKTSEDKPKMKRLYYQHILGLSIQKCEN